jgi:hypothetical protein
MWRWVTNQIPHFFTAYSFSLSHFFFSICIFYLHSTWDTKMFLMLNFILKIKRFTQWILIFFTLFNEYQYYFNI